MRKPRIRLAVIAFIGWIISLYFSNYLLNQDTFIKDKNCYVVGNHETMKPEEEIAEILNHGIDSKYKKIVKNSQKLLDNHTNLQWF